MSEIQLETERLILRNWCEEDRALFHHINSDEEIMEFFPFRRDRETSDKFMDIIRDGITKNRYGFMPIVLKETNEALGFCGLHHCSTQMAQNEDGIEIGWRLAKKHWGKGYVSEAARAHLKYGFETLSLKEVVSFAVKANHRSFAVMERLGLKRDEARDFDHPDVPDAYVHLKPHLFYAITLEDYKISQK